MDLNNSPKNFNLKSIDFGEDFVFGVSTSAYQIEGAYNVQDKGMSIWDAFTSKKKTVFQNQNGQIACDFYNKFEEDILLMKSMNIKHFRFSLAWSRIIPNGIGEVSKNGIDFYNGVIDFCLECGITPWVTLYHWDLPQALEDKGGWTNRDVVSWFENYAQVCAVHFGDRVKHWMVINEPMVFTGAGYFLGVHAPGRKGLKNFLPAIHHAVLCQAIGGKMLRYMVPDALIGTTFSCSQITPYRNKQKDILAAKKADVMLNRLFVEPLLGLGYPTEHVPVLKRIEAYMWPEDHKNMVFDFDFIGVQNYTREVVRHSPFVPYLRTKIVKASRRNVKRTLMDWEVYPESIYHMLHQFGKYEGVKKIVITENGAAFTDNLINNEIDDQERLQYLQSHLEQVYKAKEEGINVSGYFVWTFTDNFEWAEGFRTRFGLVYNNFKTQQRIVKSSGKWFKDFLSNNYKKNSPLVKSKKAIK